MRWLARQRELVRGLPPGIAAHVLLLTFREWFAEASLLALLWAFPSEYVAIHLRAHERWGVAIPDRLITEIQRVGHEQAVDAGLHPERWANKLPGER